MIHEQVLLIGSIAVTYLVTTYLMYKRFSAPSRTHGLKIERQELTVIFIIGIIAAGAGNIFKNPFINQAAWMIAKSTIFIFLATQLILMLTAGFISDIYHKRIPSWLILAIALITGGLGALSSVVLAQNDPEIMRKTLTGLSGAFITLTALFIATLIINATLRIMRRADR